MQKTEEEKIKEFAKQNKKELERKIKQEKKLRKDFSKGKVDWCNAVGIKRIL